MAILHFSATAIGMLGEAIQDLGKNGYIKDFPFSRFWSDATMREIDARALVMHRMAIGREFCAEAN